MCSESWACGVLKVNRGILVFLPGCESGCAPSGCQGDQVRLLGHLATALHAWVPSGEAGGCDTSHHAIHRSAPSFCFRISHCEGKTQFLRHSVHCVLRSAFWIFRTFSLHLWRKKIQLWKEFWVLTVSHYNIVLIPLVLESTDAYLVPWPITEIGSQPLRSSAISAGLPQFYANRNPGVADFH